MDKDVSDLINEILILSGNPPIDEWIDRYPPIPSYGDVSCGRDSIQEAETKANLINIDFNNDTPLPLLDDYAYNFINESKKPVYLRKATLQHMNLNHSHDVKKEDYKFILGESLYKYNMILPSKDFGSIDSYGNMKKRFNFIKRDINTNTHMLTLLSVKNKEIYVDIVHLHWIGEKKLKSLLKKE